MCGHEKSYDPECVKICTGFIITLEDFQVLWVSKLQTETAILTMEEEVIALYYCFREIFTIIYITKLISEAIVFPLGEKMMKVSIHKDNVGAMFLEDTLIPQFTLISKYYALKLVWFCEETQKSGIKFLKIDTVNQLGDMLTKGLAVATFEHIWKKIIAW